MKGEITMDENLKEVVFHVYCKKCKHMRLKGWEEPCNSCLEIPAREGTVVPENFEEKER